MRMSSAIAVLAGAAGVTTCALVSSAGSGPLMAWALGTLCWMLWMAAAGVLSMIEQGPD